MWHLLFSSPKLVFLVVLYAIHMVAVLIYATLRKGCEPPRDESLPSPPAPANSQRRWSINLRRAHIVSDRRFSRVSFACRVDTDRRLWSVHHSCSTMYARMLADASEKIRLE